MKKNKILVLLFFTCHVFSTGLFMLRDKFYDEKYSNLMAYDGIGFTMPIAWPLYVVLLFAMYFSLVYVYKEKLFGYTIFIVVTVLSLFIEILSGIRVSLPHENAFGFLVSLLWGAILYDGWIIFDKNELKREIGGQSKNL